MHGTILAHRYRLDAPVQVSSRNPVWAATDTWTGRRVAAKAFPDLLPQDRRLWRREIVALTGAPLRGVVQYVDDVRVDEETWLVMPWIDGSSFPVDGRPWSELRPLVLALLGVLGPLHAAGVTHADLKPANLLVDADGAVWVLDLGFAVVRQTRVGGTAVGLNARYAAPEQLLGQHDRVGPAADLYAVGLLIRAALLGVEPAHDELRGRLTAVPALDGLDRLPADHAPAEVRAALGWLLQPDPAARPPDANAVLRALGAPPHEVPPERLAALPDPATADDLRPLFHDPSPFLHLAEDAARGLAARTGGARVAVEATLRRWLAAGEARLVGDRVEVPRATLDALVAPTPTPDDALAVDAFVEAAERDGRSERALPVLEQAAHHAATAGDVEHAVALLTRMTRLAFHVGRADAWHRARRAILATDLDHPTLAALAELTRVYLQDPGRTISPVLSDAILPDDALDAWRQAWTCQRADRDGGTDALARRLAELQPWSTTSHHRRARWEAWMGQLRYRQGRFDEAADAYAASLAHRDGGAGTLPVRVNQVDALLAAGRWDEAAAIARDTVAVAVVRRDAFAELRATTALRFAERRRGRDHPVEVRHVDEAAPVSAPWSGYVALIEAGEAWRRGDPALAAAIARRAPDAPGTSGAALSAALRLADGHGDAAAVHARVAALDRPSVQLQAWAVLARAGLGAPPMVVARDAFSRCPPGQREVEQEITSARAALHTLQEP